MTNDLDDRLFDWLPHRPPMLLLSEVLTVSADAAVSRIRLSDESPFYLPALGGVPSCVGIEYLGQTAALSNGWQQQQGLAKPTLGIFLGCRRYTAHVHSFDADTVMRVEAGDAKFAGDSLVTFAGHIFCDQTNKQLASGVLTVLRRPVEEV